VGSSARHVAPSTGGGCESRRARPACVAMPGSAAESKSAGSGSASTAAERPQLGNAALSAEELERLRRQVCTKCKRNGLSPNPCPRRHKGPYLVFTSSHSSECLPCRNYCNSCCKTTSKQDIVDQVNSSEQKQKEYNESRSQHEKLFDESPGQLRGVRDKIDIPEFINAIEESSTEGRMCVGVFWPKDVTCANLWQPDKLLGLLVRVVSTMPVILHFPRGAIDS